MHIYKAGVDRCDGQGRVFQKCLTHWSFQGAKRNFLAYFLRAVGSNKPLRTPSGVCLRLYIGSVGTCLEWAKPWIPLLELQGRRECRVDRGREKGEGKMTCQETESDSDFITPSAEVKDTRHFRTRLYPKRFQCISTTLQSSDGPTG